MFIAQVLVEPSKQLNPKESQLAGGKPVGYLQAWSRIWTRSYRETNPGSGQSGTRTRNRRIASPTRWTLDHAASSSSFHSNELKDFFSFAVGRQL